MADATHLRGGFHIKPLSRKPLGDEVYHTLRKMIVQGPIEPGVKVVEAQLANSLGVSRTPVREAMKRMEYEGLLVSRPGYSTRVTIPSIADIEEIYPLIAVLEGLAAQLAVPHLTNSDLDYMEELARAMAHHARRGETEELVSADTQFHAVLHNRSQNPRVRSVVADLRRQVERLEYTFFSIPQAVRGSLERHKKLVRVLRRRDPRAAQRALERQWDLGRKALVEMLSRRGVPAGPGTGKGRDTSGQELAEVSVG